MTFSQYIRLLSFDDLLTIDDTVRKEITRRGNFINCLASVRLKELSLTINTRDLLYRVVNSRLNEPASKKNSDLTIKDLFTLLKKEDWIYIEYLNARAFGEIKDALMRNNALLEDYYGVFNEKADKSLHRRLIQIIDTDLYNG